MFRLGADTFLEIGARPILTALGRQSPSNRQTRWLASLKFGVDDWTQLTETVAELHVRGVAVDWQAFDADHARRRVVLPTYPFQRKRHWFRGANLPGADQPQTGSVDHRQLAGDLDAFQEIHWRPRSHLDQYLARRPADYLPDTATQAERLQPEIERIASQYRHKRSRQFETVLEQLATAFVQESLTGPGWDTSGMSSFTAHELQRRLGVASRHGRLFGRLLEIVAGEGLAKNSGPRLQAAAAVASGPGASELADRARQEFPEGAAELRLLSRCGEHLAAVLRGQMDPVQVLFPSASPELVENLYQDSPWSRTLNALVEESVVAAVERVPAGRCVRILEIGAGTGGTTAGILPRLAGHPVEYVFSDVSDVFVHNARDKFRQYPFVRYPVLDIERDPADQGFAAGQFDILVAANVLHATADLRQAVTHVQRLLTPGGMLVLVEGTRKSAWLDLIFGLTEGWWRFRDHDLRPDHPLLSQSRWKRLLTGAGFDQPLAVPDAAAGLAEPVPAQSVFIVRKGTREIPRAAAREDAPGEASRTPALPPGGESRFQRFLIFADQGGAGECLASTLREAGHECRLVFHGHRGFRFGDYRTTVSPDQPESIQRVFDHCLDNDFAIDQVVYLWALDAAPVVQLSSASLQRAQVLGCHGALATIQSMVRSRLAAGCRLWLVTAGAQPVSADSQMTGLAQASLWGLGRVLSEELPDIRGGLVDLDPHMSFEQFGELLAREVVDPGGEDQIAWRGDQRFCGRLVRRREQRLPRPLRWRADGSYLISGGLGEIGLRIARWIAQQGAKNIILLGRTKLPPRCQWPDQADHDSPLGRKIREIHHIERLGATVQVLPVDVADETQLADGLRSLADTGQPPIRGVIHAAGLAGPEPLLELNAARFDQVLRPKVAGTWQLHQLLCNERLDFFVGFSSGAALLGSPMLGSYAAANSFLDALIHYRRSIGQTGLSVNWGFWAEIGMVARSQREAGRVFAPQGMQSFSPQQGIAAMQHLLEVDATQSSFMPVDWGQWAEHHPHASAAPLFRELLDHRSAGDPSQIPVTDDPTITREAILAESAETQIRLVEKFLCSRLSHVLRIPIEELDVSRPLNHLGIDSLMAMELRNHIQSHFGVVVPVARLMQNPGTRQLSQTLVRLLSESASGDLQPHSPVPADDVSWSARVEPVDRNGSDPATQVSAMTDEEVDRMLEELLDQKSVT
jgi:acyl transferase domain-containing protein/acyl carrier protein